MSASGRSIPLLRHDVISRKDPAGELLFQVSTDEMYLVDESTFALLGLCDGERTIGRIAEEVARAQAQPSRVPDYVSLLTPFFEELARRDLIQLWEAP